MQIIKRLLAAKRFFSYWVSRTRLIALYYPQGAWRGKVFCVGRNKTGTTTLYTVFASMGYGMAAQVKGEKLISEAGLKADERFWSWVDEHQVFQDAPFSAGWLLPELIERYPTARFILTIRDENEWYQSLRNHHFEHLGLSNEATGEEIKLSMKKDSYIAEGYFYAQYLRNHGDVDDNLLYNKECLIEAYREHNDLVRRLVPSNQLLEIDLAEHNTTASLCEFLNLPRRFLTVMPRENQRR